MSINSILAKRVERVQIARKKSRNRQLRWISTLHNKRLSLRAIKRLRKTEKSFNRAMKDLAFTDVDLTGTYKQFENIIGKFKI